MKNLIVGGIGVLTSMLLFGVTLISASIYSLYLSQPAGDGWDSNLGVFGTALINIGTIPLILSLVFFIVGIRYVYKGIKE
ncbi:phosphatase [Gottfriedia acidiceleris]|uniref:Phosphatase n=1 Tax=Gottfriedia acidiceleris TaxID=371036 RepID=A0ABY4JFS1_9BACI|nr:phosphatase [Gottfriedia acidiceleris]UPM52679.1 phosphatase [Gottfriedia acidiceleris]